jgi:photosystem II stability/assembly factor-like uncharacterized protein
MTTLLPPTLSNTNGSYSGTCYAFGASGGYTVQQGVNQINLRTPDVMSKYDVTDAIQVRFSARALNRQISVIKDASNLNTVQAWFDPITDTLHYDNLKLCACDFVNGVNTESVISVGKLSTLYTDFQSCVNTYFGDPGGFASLFSGDQELKVNGGVFDASAYIQVVNSSKFTMEGSFVSDLSGQVSISDINKLLKYVVDTNIFNNRNPSIHNWGVVDGFVAGDLVFIPAGFTIALSVDIEAETYLPINNVGPSYLNSIRNRLNWTRGYVTRTTTATTTNITQTTTVPILLVLTDESLENFSNYGVEWVLVVPSINDASGNPYTKPPEEFILTTALSATGLYQASITNLGNILVSNNGGQQWTVPTNIGPSNVNTIGMSFTGMNQTVSNGHQIYVSNDYGETWQSTFSGGTTNIFVAVSLCGKYQTMISSGDNLYTSDNFGLNWVPLSEYSELYQSIEAFPTGGIAISYTGRYQTIVSEAIYISDDFGITWFNVSDQNGFDDRNWSGIAMASTGQYQTAVENGGDIHVSNDYGRSWLFVDNEFVHNKIWQGISMSATGQYQTAIETNGKIHKSIDYGVTWDSVSNDIVSYNNWVSITVSSDAMYQTAIDASGNMYVSSILGGSNTCSC